MEAADWSASPLGPPAHWPHSLRTVVRILLTSRYAMWMGWGPDLTFLYNDAYARMTLGAKHPWALGRPAREVWEEIWPQIGPRIEKVLTTGEATWDERLLLFLERSGYREETYHTFSYSPLPNDRGEICGHLCVVTEETERAIDERRLAVLKELGGHLAVAKGEGDVLDAAGRALETDSRDLPFSIIYLFSADGRASLVASAGIDEAGAVPRELALRDLAAAWGVGGDGSWGEPREVPAPAFATWPARPWERQSDSVFIVPIRQQGQPVPAGVFIAGVNPFRRIDEKYRSFVNLFVGQLTAGLANARAYEEERRRNDALAAIDRAKSAFFSNVSHEFRTPLTLMLGPTEDALNEPDGALRGENLRTVYRNEVRLLRMVNALLDFSRIEAGRVQPFFEPVDLSALTVELAGAFRSAVERGGLRFEVECPPLPAAVYVDRQMWEKVVLNLLSNAFKFTFEGSIRVQLSSADGRIVLVVADTGVGIAIDQQPRVFERFHRIEGVRARTHEGTGIGLALVHDLVQLHGGTIAVDSEPGRGTTFTVTMPAGCDHLPAGQVADGARPAAALGAAAFVIEAERWLPGAHDDARVAPPSPGALSAVAEDAPRILLVDDNADMRDYLTRLLRTRWQVDVAGDGDEALAQVRRRRPALVLSDVMMPKLDGFGLLRELRADPATRDVPVILLSARAGEESRVEGMDAGADDYLVKPFSARELLARVATQLEVQRLGRRLAQEREAVAELFRQSPVPVAILRGPQLVFEFVNQAYVDAAGSRPIVGKPMLEALPELRGQGFDELLLQVMRTGEPMVGREQLVQVERDGALVDTYFTFVYSALTRDGGPADGVVAICNDVTEQVQARRDLQALATAAEEANRAKDEFLAMLGHELRNPLAPILTALQLIRLKGVTQIEAERTVIERQTRHLVRLVDDLLDVSRIARGKIELKREPVELAQVIARAIELASPLFEARGQLLETDVPPAGLTAYVDPARMSQAIANLLTNAAKYSEPEGRIQVRAAREGDELVIAVRDGGIGIQREMLPHIFELFVQERQALDRSHGGLGLGLTIVRNIVNLHGGSVAAFSEGIGRGSEFVLRLPPAAVAASPGAAVALSPAVRPAGGSRLLVVDDNEDAARMLSASLTLKGHDVRIALDGPAALALVQEFRPDVGLLDIGLPAMDGYELASKLRVLPGLADLGLIAVTGYGQQGDRSRAAAAGFVAHLVKPVDIDKLDTIVRSIAKAGATRRG